LLSAPPSSRGGTPPSDVKVKGTIKTAAPPPLPEEDKGEEEVADESPVESEDDDDATQK